MTLKEIRGDTEISHPDDKKLSQTEWAKLLGVASSTISEAVRVSGARAERVQDHSIGRVVTPVGEFPKIIDYLGRRQMRRSVNPWALGVDTMEDFRVTAPSGTELEYKYPRKGPSYYLKKIFDRFGR